MEKISLQLWNFFSPFLSNENAWDFSLQKAFFYFLRGICNLFHVPRTRPLHIFFELYDFTDSRSRYFSLLGIEKKMKWVPNLVLSAWHKFYLWGNERKVGCSDKSHAVSFVENGEQIFLSEKVREIFSTIGSEKKLLESLGLFKSGLEVELFASFLQSLDKVCHSASKFIRIFF